jgi:hypothetical protein
MADAASLSVFPNIVKIIVRTLLCCFAAEETVKWCCWELKSTYYKNGLKGVEDGYQRSGSWKRNIEIEH